MVSSLTTSKQGLCINLPHQTVAKEQFAYMLDFKILIEADSEKLQF